MNKPPGLPHVPCAAGFFRLGHHGMRDLYGSKPPRERS